MSETKKRIIAGCVMALIALAAGVGEYFGFGAVRYLTIIIALAMIAETIICMVRTSRDVWRKNAVAFIAFLVLLGLVLMAANYVGARPWIILLMLMIICSADIGAWFFGKLIGGDKMWERLSSGKTWSGQIAGIICGTAASIMYGLLGADIFMPQLMWIGISVALLSQYGDLTASWIKRKIGIKDFGNIIPGHGGVLDRFDGWIYVLPIVWLVML
ncbi:MAG: phosphatidate cytidylyltransferase [Muribaculaceae bacterium]|nr:phosphatidate cytidylyltransferase [Muribaculaceae bacterium]